MDEDRIGDGIMGVLTQVESEKKEAEVLGDGDQTTKPKPITGNHRDEAGDPACWASELCPDCGSVSSDGYHCDGCEHRESQ